MQFDHHYVVRVCAIVAALCSAPFAQAVDLYRPEATASLISDRRASQVGDVLTVLIYENSSARHDIRTQAESDVGFSGRLHSPTLDERSYGLSVGTTRGGGGKTQQSGNLLAQLSVSVTETAPNGDLYICGEQSIDINGELRTIRLNGRVRPVDIRHDNVVLSSHVADASIAYVGDGDLSRRARPGLISWLLGLFRPW